MISPSRLDLFKLSASTLLLSGIYLGLFLLGMVKIFIYGESSVPDHSSNMKTFWVHRKQADKLMREEQTKGEMLTKHLRLAVEALGKPGLS